MILTETPRRKRVEKLVNWGHWFALLNIILAIVIASVYVFTSPLPGTMLGTLYLFANWFSHMGFLTFMGFVIVILPLCYLVPRANLVKGISSVVAASGLALLAFDALLYNKHGLHLSLSSADLIKIEAQTVIGQFGWQQWGFLGLLFVVWLSFQLVVANAIWKRIERLQRFKLGLPISSFFVLCFISSHAIHVWADANLYQPIVQQDDMFPLSYPATAKTLMSKHGLLDLQNYKQRKALQFDYALKDIRYPAEPVYCGIDQDQRMLLLIATDDLNKVDLPETLNMSQSHYSLSSDFQSMVTTTLFGLPEVYRPSLMEKTPLLLDLPSKLATPVSIYSDTVIEHAQIAQFTVSWQRFVEKVSEPTGKLAIGFVNNKQLNALLDLGVTDSHRVLITHYDSEAVNGAALYSNLDLVSRLSSNEDFAPTILNELGCMADATHYSTGRILTTKQRDWLVGTTGNKVVVLYNGHRIEVLSNGNYKIYDRDTGEESVTPLNTSLLSQAMKHLSRFYR